MAKKVKVMSSDNEIFEVEESVLREWEPFKDMTEDIATGAVIHLQNVCSKVLEQAIKYCSYHLECQKNSDENRNISPQEIKNWDTEFLNMKFSMLVDLLNAANSLNMASLLDLTSQAVANMMKGKTYEEIHRIFNQFNVTSDFTLEEEEAMRMEPIPHDLGEQGHMHIAGWVSHCSIGLENLLAAEGVSHLSPSQNGG